MRKILWLNVPKITLDTYFDRYLDFYTQMYLDTGLWNEDQIIVSYIEQSSLRKKELFHLIQTRLSPDSIVGYHEKKGLYIPWRSKTLWVQWRDDGDSRTIVDLKIQ